MEDRPTVTENPMVVLPGRNIAVEEPYASFCPCERMKLKRGGTSLCELCWAIENYKAGRYAMNLKNLTQGSVVLLRNGREVVVKRIYRRDPNSPHSSFLCNLDRIDQVVDFTEIKSVVHL